MYSAVYQSIYHRVKLRLDSLSLSTGMGDSFQRWLSRCVYGSLQEATLPTEET